MKEEIEQKKKEAVKTIGDSLMKIATAVGSTALKILFVWYVWNWLGVRFVPTHFSYIEIAAIYISIKFLKN